MSQKIKTRWECPACTAKNPAMPTKPRPFQASLYNTTCEVCDSEASIRFQKSPSKTGEYLVAYEFVDFVISAAGQKKMNELMKKQEKQTTPSETAEQQKEV